MYRVLFAATLATFAILSAHVAQAQSRNSIEGRVTTPDNTALVNVRVFLLNDGYGQRGQTYTNGSGRFVFRNLGIGNYYVQVEAAGTGYERQMQRVEVNPYTPGGGGSEIFRIDFVLKPQKPSNVTGQNTDVAPGANMVIFAQDVPANAKEAYQQGEQSVKKADLKNAEISLTHAIQIFPDYYEALELLGSEYVKHNFFDAAVPLLSHAVEINKNAWHSFYGLGVSQLELNQRKEGLDSLRHAVALNPKSVNASMRLGIELAKDTQHSDEAINLLANVTQMAGKQLPEAYLILASLYSNKEQYQKAADALEAYVLTKPQADQLQSVKLKIEQLHQKAKLSKPRS
jgi:tetratricopeptide (TPR) repeat protein